MKARRSLQIYERKITENEEGKKQQEANGWNNVIIKIQWNKASGIRVKRIDEKTLACAWVCENKEKTGVRCNVCWETDRETIYKQWNLWKIIYMADDKADDEDNDDDDDAGTYCVVL